MPCSIGLGLTRAFSPVRAGTDNRIVDVEGFANWGNPGWAVDYDDAGFVGGVLMGKKFETGGVPFRIEFDGTFGGLSAASNKLDPEGLDETVETEFRWIATARVGVEQAVGPATVFASRRAGGYAGRQFGDRHRFRPRHADADGPRRFLSRRLHGGRLGGRGRCRSTAVRCLDFADRGLVSGFRAQHPLREPLRRWALRTGKLSQALPLRHRARVRYGAFGDHLPVRPVAKARARQCQR